MGRINEYPSDTKPKANDIVLVDGSAGTRKVTLTDLANTLPGSADVTNRRSWFRGKDLGSVFTDAQKTAIKNGTFDDLYVGDYWYIGGVNWRIADFDYWLRTGDTACTKHHVAIMPDKSLYNYPMNDTDTTAGGYLGSKMYTEGLNQAKEMINTAFGSVHILNHREYLTNAVTDGHPSGGTWVDSTVELPNEIMVYGSFILSPSGDGSIIVKRFTIDKQQLALFATSQSYVNVRASYWLRDVVFSAAFAYVHSVGLTNYQRSSTSVGVRPVFGLTGG